MPHFWSIFIITVIVSLITTVIYKYASNQKELKRIKEEVKKYQEEIKKHRNNPKKAMEIQKKMFSLSGEQMKHSLSSMLYTFIPVILIFGWMSASLAFEPLSPGVPFNVTVYAENVNLSSIPPLDVISSSQERDGKYLTTVYTLKGDAGEYTLWLEKAGERKSADIIISDKQSYLGPAFTFKNSVLNKAVVGNKDVKPLGSVSLLGWHPGWLGTYILLSIVFTMLLRKLLKVY